MESSLRRENSTRLEESAGRKCANYVRAAVYERNSRRVAFCILVYTSDIFSSTFDCLKLTVRDLARNLFASVTRIVDLNQSEVSLILKNGVCVRREQIHERMKGNQ